MTSWESPSGMDCITTSWPISPYSVVQSPAGYLFFQNTTIPVAFYSSSGYLGDLISQPPPDLKTQLLLAAANARKLAAGEPVSGFEPLACRLRDGCSAN
jgi:hypothetical protein